jgi:hypothetical protein
MIYLATLSVPGLCSVGWKDDQWIGKNSEESGDGLIEVLFRILLEGLKKAWKTSVRIAGDPVEIATTTRIVSFPSSYVTHTIVRSV